jgi:hypothetical protein
MVVIYHQNTPLPKMRKGLDGYTFLINKVSFYISSNFGDDQDLLHIHQTLLGLHRHRHQVSRFSMATNVGITI